MSSRRNDASSYPSFYCASATESLAELYVSTVAQMVCIVGQELAIAGPETSRHRSEGIRLPGEQSWATVPEVNGRVVVCEWVYSGGLRLIGHCNGTYLPSLGAVAFGVEALYVRGS